MIMIYVEGGILKINLSVMKVSMKIIIPIIFSMRPIAALLSKKLPPDLKKRTYFRPPSITCIFIS